MTGGLHGTLPRARLSNVGLNWWAPHPPWAHLRSWSRPVFQTEGSGGWDWGASQSICSGFCRGRALLLGPRMEGIMEEETCPGGRGAGEFWARSQVCF